jgi:hypothetical protein
LDHKRSAFFVEHFLAQLFSCLSRVCGHRGVRHEGGRKVTTFFLVFVGQFLDVPCVQVTGGGQEVCGAPIKTTTTTCTPSPPVHSPATQNRISSALLNLPSPGPKGRGVLNCNDPISVIALGRVWQLKSDGEGCSPRDARLKADPPCQGRTFVQPHPSGQKPFQIMKKRNLSLVLVFVST